MTDYVDLKFTEDHILCAAWCIRMAHKAGYNPSNIDKNIKCTPYELFKIISDKLVKDGIIV